MTSSTPVMPLGSLPPDDADLFSEFVEALSYRAMRDLEIEVEPDPAPWTIRGGPAALHRYQFPPDRARSEGLDMVVEEALARLRADRP